ncbi:MAG: hypothetical protein KF725_14195 [Cyclobacteriaceae bacterium]|nr:hypothetical protein [Cyclobacteriaceae bacterium]UYN87488.1 MAG: hypothetical protein KIT51_04260 [Cyclobacteriaceae bacterium]
MNARIFTCMLVLACSSLYAQRLKTVELKPIYKQGLRYYYDMNRVRTPFALQVPLQSLNDEEINRRYKNFTRLSDVGGLLAFAPLIYILSGTYSSGTSFNPNTFLSLLVAAFGLDITLDLFAHHQLRKGIDRYNELIVVPASNTPGLALRYKF